MAGGGEPLSGSILDGRYRAEDLAVQTEPVWVLSHNLALGAVPRGVDVAGLAHVPEEAEVLHDELLRGCRPGRQLEVLATERVGELEDLLDFRPERLGDSKRVVVSHVTVKCPA